VCGRLFSEESLKVITAAIPRQKKLAILRESPLSGRKGKREGEGGKTTRPRWSFIEIDKSTTAHPKGVQLEGIPVLDWAAHRGEWWSE